MCSLNELLARLDAVMNGSEAGQALCLLQTSFEIGALLSVLLSTESGRVLQPGDLGSGSTEDIL